MQSKNKALLADLLSKDMDRKDFLMHVGGAFLAVIGISGLINKLADPFGKQQRTASVGYGNSAYGGSAERTSQRKS